MKRSGSYIKNFLYPSLVLGSTTGAVTAAVVLVYKLCAKHAIHLSEAAYAFLRGHWYWALPAAAVLFGLAWLMAYIYKKTPNLGGGGIPTSIAALRGIISFRWLQNLVGVFFLSLTSFLVGVPLGNEGPSVQMGTAIGRGTVRCLGKNNRAWDRYAMTGGACAGFAVATGAPISGIMFAVEEAHQRISPMIITVSAISVLFSALVTHLLAPVLGVSAALFPELEPAALRLGDVWLPVAVGAAVGLFAVLFLWFYRVVDRLSDVALKKVHLRYKIFAVLALTLAAGMFSTDFISTGHELILALFEGRAAIYMLLLILAVRSALTLSANANRITGGMFVPLLALGAAVSALLAGVVCPVFGLGQEYYVIILVLGITACIASMMKMPITAIVFAVEALGCYENILYVIIVSAVAYMITEIFHATSINDKIIEDRVEEIGHAHDLLVLDTHVTVQPGSFAIGKQIRDVLWPTNLFVLSVTHAEDSDAMVDVHGGSALRQGDVLHVRYSTRDEAETHRALAAIVGEQEYALTEAAEK